MEAPDSLDVCQLLDQVKEKYTDRVCALQSEVLALQTKLVGTEALHNYGDKKVNIACKNAKADVDSMSVSSNEEARSHPPHRTPPISSSKVPEFWTGPPPDEETRSCAPHKTPHTLHSVEARSHPAYKTLPTYPNKISEFQVGPRKAAGFHLENGTGWSKADGCQDRDVVVPQIDVDATTKAAPVLRGRPALKSNGDAVSPAGASIVLRAGGSMSSQTTWRSNKFSVSSFSAKGSSRSSTLTSNRLADPKDAHDHKRRASALNHLIAIDDGEPDVFSAMNSLQGLPAIADEIQATTTLLNPPPSEIVHRFLNSTRYDVFVATLIISYTGFMGYQIDWTSKNVGFEIPIWQQVLGHIYTSVFMFELGLRLFDERLTFFMCNNKLWHWNYLDFFIVTTSLVELLFEAMIDTRQFRFLRIIRISRLIKILRIARLVRFVRALRTLVYSIIHTLKSVFWALLLLLIIIYVFAMVLTQATATHQEFDRCAPQETLCEFWGTLGVSMLSLFKAVAGGVSWHDILDPMAKKLDAIWVVVFLAYILFVYFAVLNVITGVFCESAIQSAKLDEEMVIHETLIRKRNYLRKLSLLFDQIDTDGSHEISLHELEAFMDKEMSGAFFEYLELDVNGALDVIKLLDADQSGKLSREEFIQGVCRLRGPATAMGVAHLSFDCRMFHDDVYRALDDMSDKLRTIMFRCSDR